MVLLKHLKRRSVGRKTKLPKDKCDTLYKVDNTNSLKHGINSNQK